MTQSLRIVRAALWLTLLVAVAIALSACAGRDRPVFVEPGAGLSPPGELLLEPTKPERLDSSKPMRLPEFLEAVGGIVGHDVDLAGKLKAIQAWGRSNNGWASAEKHGPTDGDAAAAASPARDTTGGTHRGGVVVVHGTMGRIDRILPGLIAEPKRPAVGRSSIDTVAGDVENSALSGVPSGKVIDAAATIGDDVGDVAAVGTAADPVEDDVSDSNDLGVATSGTLSEQSSRQHVLFGGG